MEKPLKLLAFVLLATASLGAQERTITRAALPAAVEKTLQSNLAGSTLKALATEREGGRRVYEAETLLNGHTRDLQFTADGTLIEIEEEVALVSLSPSVQQALKQKAGAARITKVESLTKKDQLVAYEASTRNGNRRGEVQVGPNGESLKHSQ